MGLPKISSKHLQIDKANQTVLIITSACIVITIFGLFFIRSLLQIQAHQNRVIKEKKVALKQLNANVAAKDKIVESYKQFTSGSVNALGGNADPNATGKLDGDNARLVLDALPSKYDFPALATSVEALMTENKYSIASIEGQDDEVNQETVAPQATPQPVEVPFSFTANGTDYKGAKQLVQLLQSSIRPFKIQKIKLTASQGATIDVELSVVTYYQPPKELSITQKVVK